MEYPIEKDNAIRVVFSAMEEAEKQFGITQQQVSRWAKGLKDPDSYRRRLYSRAYAAAMGLDRGTAKRTIKEAARRQLPEGDCLIDLLARDIGHGLKWIDVFVIQVGYRPPHAVDAVPRGAVLQNLAAHCSHSVKYRFLNSLALASNWRCKSAILTWKR